MIDQSFDDNFQSFVEVHHLIVIEMIDVLSHFVFVFHQRTKHDHMFDRLSISIASTRRRLYFENFSFVQKVDEVNFFRANLRRQRAFCSLQFFMQFESFLVDVFYLCRDRIEHDLSINRSDDRSLLDVMLFNFSYALLQEFIFVEDVLRTIRSRC